MSPTNFYNEQAAEQQRAADDAGLDNVRDRCQRAANAWTALAVRSERGDAARERSAAEKADAAGTPDGDEMTDADWAAFEKSGA